MMTNDLEIKWERLTTWLESQHPGYKANVKWKEVPGAGRGLFTTREIKGGEPLLDIPSTALLNPLTLSSTSTIPTRLFPLPRSVHKLKAKKPRLSDPSPSENPQNRPRLNTTQLLTLHLLLTRDPRRRHESPWAAYIDTLPMTFKPWHPLTWVVGGQDDEEVGVSWSSKGKHKRRERWDRLVGCLSEGARAKLADVERRYQEDIKLLKGVLREDEPFISQGLLSAFSTDDYLWSWLNTNTRTVSIPLNLPDPNEVHNHALVPILDFANHSSDPKRTIPRPLQIPSTSAASTGPSLRPPRLGMSAHLVVGKIGFRLIAPEAGLKEGAEVLFEYGAHSNSVLLAEYGFRDGVAPAAFEAGEKVEKDWREGLRYGEVDFGVAVERLWSENTKQERETKEEVLRSINCFGGNTIMANPYPPHPSYPFLMTLRLMYYHISSPPTQSETQKLQAITSGMISFISSENEAKVVASLEQITNRFLKDCGERLKRLKLLEEDINSFVVRGRSEEGNRMAVQDGSDGMLDGLHAVRDMCREEMGIVLAFKAELDSGKADFT